VSSKWTNGSLGPAAGKLRCEELLD